MDYLYDFIGALVGTWVIFNVFKIIFVKFLDKKTVHYVSFIGSFILILVLTSYTMGFVTGFITYMPALFIWFVVGLIKTNKKKVKDERSNTDSLHINS